MIEDLKSDMDFVELTADETTIAIKGAGAQGVRGARVHDLMHATAAAKYKADVLLTLDDSGFAALKQPVKVQTP